MRGTDVFHVSEWIHDVPKGCKGDRKFSHPVQPYSPFRHPVVWSFGFLPYGIAMPEAHGYVVSS